MTSMLRGDPAEAQSAAISAGADSSCRVVDAFVTYLNRRFSEVGAGQAFAVSGRSGSTSKRLPPNGVDALVLVGDKPLLGRRLRRRFGLSPSFNGHLHDAQLGRLPFAVLDRFDISRLKPAPADFEVLAIVTTFNEIDVIEPLIRRLRSDQVRVHVVDNWSQDGTAEIVSKLRDDDKGITLERFPPTGPSLHFELQKLLGRVEEVAHFSSADWIVHHDADEIRMAPWRHLSLRQGLYAVDQFGFNCVDHTVVNFRPVDNSWISGSDLTAAFEHYEFGEAPAHFVQEKAFKRQTQPIRMAYSGGHVADFSGKRVFPYKFLTLHYPIRSQDHGERKILLERKSRFSPEERARDWHTHYDHYGQGSSFLWNAASLQRWSKVDDDLLLQRLSGVELPNNPFPGEGPK